MKAPPLDLQVKFLSRVPLFHGIEPGLLRALAGMMQLTREPAGTVLCEQGSAGDACFVVGHGDVVVYIGSGNDIRELATLGAGHVVGEVSLVDGKKRSASVKCKSDASIFSLRRMDFDQMLSVGNAASLGLLDNIARDLASRVRAVNQQYADIFSQSGQTLEKLNEKLAKLRACTEVVESDGNEDELMKLLGYQSPSG